MSNDSRPVIRRTTALVATACMVGAATGTLALTENAASAPAQRVQILEAKLRPSGDPNGAGTASFRLNKAKKRVCADVTWKRIETPNAAHIHRGKDGSIAVDLSGSVTGGAKCATGVPKKLVGRILQHPRRYYFNVHNETYPAGAIQGVLRR